MGHAYSSQAVENLKVKDIAQRLGTFRVRKTW